MKAVNKILLTADKSLLNDFHLKQNISQFFYGSGDLLPAWIFKLLATPPKIENGVVKFAPYPLRKVEAKLLDLGYNASTISYTQIPKLIQSAKVLGIHTVNPLGMAFNTYLRNFLNEKRAKPTYFFCQLMKNKYLRNAKKNGLKIIIGGQGAWQFEHKPELLTELGIDCVIIGESELVMDEILTKALNDKKLPPIVKVGHQKTPTIDEISEIKYPSISGCVEIGRGCPRHCNFCEVTKANLRWYPKSKIEKELMVNNRSGLKYGILHAEDVFLYGQNSVIPDKKRIIDLIKLSKRFHQNIHFTHVSIASSSVIPDLIESVMEEILQNQEYLVVEVGIETGSVNSLKMNMRSKVKPFKPEQWCELIYECLGKMHDNMIIPFCSLIFGLPNETISDKEDTLELIKSLKDFRSVLFPVNYIPLGNQKEQRRFFDNLEELDEIEREICFQCLEHDLKWVNDSKKYLYNRSKYKFLIEVLSRIWMFQYKRNISRYRKQIGNQ